MNVLTSFSALLGAAVLLTSRTPVADRAHASATPSVCRSPDRNTRLHLHYVREMTGALTASLDSSRVNLLLPLVADTLADVYVVQDSPLCATALAAYRSVVDTAAQGATSVELIRAGTVYIVSSPDVQPGQGEYTNRIVFDSTFRMLSNYLM